MEPTRGVFDYNIYATAVLDEMAEHTKHMLNTGWQKASQLLATPGGMYIQEYIKMIPPDENQHYVDDKDFRRKLSALDPQVKDLLDINNIGFACENGETYTYFGDKIAHGISPIEVLNVLKNSRHVPINLDDQKVIDEIGRLL